MAMLVVGADHLVAMTAVDGKQHQRRKIRNQNRPIERLQAIQVGKGVVGESVQNLAGCRSRKKKCGRIGDDDHVCLWLAPLKAVLSRETRFLPSPFYCISI